MWRSYFLLAWRILLKQRLYTAINLAGLSIGLGLFVFSDMLYQYEANHDHMFAERERIYTVGSLFASSSGESIREYPGVRSAYAPIIRDSIPELELVVRSLTRKRLLSVEGIRHYAPIRFVDPGFADLFDFTYRFGSAAALATDDHIALTELMALTLFGRSDVVGEKVLLEDSVPLHVGAVIADIGADTHFNSSLVPFSHMAVIAPLASLNRAEGFPLEGQWSNLPPADMTYVRMPESKSIAWLQNEIDAVYEHATPEHERSYIDRLKVRPLIDANRVVWASLGFPVFETVSGLGFLVLLIACLNYANLATAQNLGRVREVGLRRAFGAERWHLFAMNLCEAFVLILLAAVFALALLEIAIQVYNSISGKAVPLNYSTTLPALLKAAMVAGSLASIYPTWLISRPVNALHIQRGVDGRGGMIIRNTMIALQFAIAVFVTGLVLTISAQNWLVSRISAPLLNPNVVVFDGLQKLPERIDRTDLRDDMMSTEGVRAATLSSGTPFNETGGWLTAESLADGEEFRLFHLAMDDQFADFYRLPLSLGRLPEGDDDNVTEVLLNSFALAKLGIDRINSALGQEFAGSGEEADMSHRRFRIVGVMDDQYFLGVHMQMRPLMFYRDDKAYKYLSVMFDHPPNRDKLVSIEQQWQSSSDGYPSSMAPLQHFFDRFYRIPRTIATVLAGFSAIALGLALFGLFGLVAFITRNRTREIGIRKVFGADAAAIVRILIRQLSMPVMLALLIAAPLAWQAATIYLDFFPERIRHVEWVIAAGSLFCLFSACGVIALQVRKTAREKPVAALRYE